MGYSYHPCKVIQIKDEAPGVKRYTLRYPEEIALSFKAGQFVMFDLPIDSKYTNRSYSIASPPSTDNTLELVIVINPKGLGTPHLFDNVLVGSELMTSLPLGKFHLDDDLDRRICFICTGTGVAPFRSMILDVIQNEKPFKEMILLFGVRTQADILYRSEFEELSKSASNFHFIPVLSREKWNGKTGYVHDVYLELFPEPGNHLFYLCGWANMLKDARENLQNLVLDKKQIRFESYD
jgi:ferredoxin-NADP reductase